MTSIPFKSNRALQAMLAWLTGLWIITAIEPLYPRDWLIENLLVFIYATLLIGSYRRFAFSNLSYGLFTLFLSLHLIGAHYTYSEVPLGFWFQSFFELERNHYDRLVHFCFGLLIAYPFREFLLRKAQIQPAYSYFAAVCVVMAFSSFYEVLEGAVAMVVSPELGMAYLGTQGDVWDAQKDSFLAFVGAIIAMLVSWWRDRSTYAG
jgi:putative membrane protein